MELNYPLSCDVFCILRELVPTAINYCWCCWHGKLGGLGKGRHGRWAEHCSTNRPPGSSCNAGPPGGGKPYCNQCSLLCTVRSALGQNKAHEFLHDEHFEKFSIIILRTALGQTPNLALLVAKIDRIEYGMRDIIYI